MITDNNQFCFIICTNNRQYFEECVTYISLLEVPDGYTVDVLSIEDAESMTKGYNAAMNASPAKYKIYMHHDTMILNRYFLYNILKIFKSDKDIGMIGMLGNVHLEKDAVLTVDYKRCVGFNIDTGLVSYESDRITDKDYIYDVEVIDGFIVATQYDVEWREDLFDGWDFYDISQSMEFHRLDYRVVVPEQKHVWCLHADDLTSKLYDYEKYRNIFIEEYITDLENYDRHRKHIFKNDRYDTRLKERLDVFSLLSGRSDFFKQEIQKTLDLTENCLNKKSTEKIEELCKYYETNVMDFLIYRISTDLRRVYHMLLAYKLETKENLPLTIGNISNLDELIFKYVRCQMMLRRIEMGLPMELQREAFEYLGSDMISPCFIYILIGNSYSIFSQRKRLLSEICNLYLEQGDIKRANILIKMLKEDYEIED